MTTLKPIRQVTTVTMRVTLTDNGVKVSWPDLDSVKAFVYSEQQRLVAGACTVEVDGSDDTVLICTYAADKPQYLGPQKAVIVAEYQGQTSTYDKPAFTFVATTAETLSDGTTIAADTTDVDINVEDVSSSILAGAIAAALAAAENANDAADDATAAAQEARDAAASVPSVDNFYTKPEVDTIAAGKQDKLQSGENIKTVNGQSILGEGDIEIQGGDPDAVLFTEQELTPAQKEQARTNIGAGTSSFSGNYNDLSNKPSIPTVPTISTDIAADATSDAKTASPKAVKTFVEGKGYGTYSKPSGGIPKTDLEQAVRDSLGLADSAIQQHQDISGKADKVSDATNGNLAGLDSNGNITDSGKKASDFQTPLTFDSTPTQNSDNPVKSGGVYSEVHPAFGSSQPSGGMLPNILYKLGTLTGAVTIAFASPSDNTIENEYKFTFTADSTAPTITWDNAITEWQGNCLDSNGQPVMTASKIYEISVKDGLGIIIEW